MACSGLGNGGRAVQCLTEGPHLDGQRIGRREKRAGEGLGGCLTDKIVGHQNLGSSRVSFPLL